MHGTRHQSPTILVYRLVIGLVVFAVLTIPVDCAASDGPHSVFLSPSDAGVAREDSSHHHQAPSASSHQHAADTAESTSNVPRDVATDVSSQRGFSGFDVPLTINKPAESAVERASVDKHAHLNRHDNVAVAFIDPPEPPPPR